MTNWTAVDFTGFMNAVLLLITTAIIGLATALGRKSKKEPAPPEDVKIQGAAIVSSESIMLLAKEMSALNIATIERKVEEEKGRQALYRTIEAVNGMTGEMEELRHAVQNVTLEMIRAK